MLVLNMTGDVDISPVIFHFDPNFILVCLWERCGCSESIDGEESLLPLQFQLGAPIPPPPAEVLWERCGCTGSID